MPCSMAQGSIKSPQVGNLSRNNKVNKAYQVKKEHELEEGKQAMINSTTYAYNAADDPGYLLSLIGVKRLTEWHEITIVSFNRL